MELPALEFTSESSSGNYKCIVIIDGARVYLVGFGSAKGSDSAIQMDRFLGSFTLN
jgi:hypothetical protein